VKLPGGDIKDPFGGRRDLESGHLKLIFDRAFEEDPLRMLRAMGFAARFDLQLDDPLRERLISQVDLLREVSAERTAEEFTKLFTRATHPSRALRLMAQTGMLDVLLPELRPSVDCDQPGPYHAYDVYEHTCRTVDACPARLALRWAALLHDVAKPETKHFKGDRVTFYNHENIGADTARKILGRLRYGREIEEHVAILIERHLFNTDMGDRGLRRLIKAVGPDRLPDLLDLRRADVEAQGMGGSTEDVDEFEKRIRGELEAHRPFSRSDLALDGHMLMTELGLTAGPVLGGVLDHLMERVLDDPDGNDRSTLMRWAQEYVRGDSVMVACAVLGSMAAIGG
jgi:putative nucleotidyltransferase with HDIG domain